MFKNFFYALIISLIPFSLLADNGVLPYGVGEDGLYKQRWINQTTMDLKQDFINAQQRDKILVYLFEQPGCVYCKYMHEEVFSDKEVSDIIEKHFYFIQIQMAGMIPLKDFDGKEYQEKDFSRLNKIIGTPSMVFFDSKKPVDSFNSLLNAEVLTLPGAFKKEDMTKFLLSLVD